MAMKHTCVYHPLPQSVSLVCHVRKHVCYMKSRVEQIDISAGLFPDFGETYSNSSLFTVYN